MDPFTGVLVLMFMTVGAKAVLGGVTDLWAKARGETPPSLEKWRERQKDRAARGSKPEEDPGPWRRRFRNAAERLAEKAAQKHTAKMERLRENARDNIDGYKDKYAKRAERRRKIMDKLASWAMGVKDGVKNWYDEWQAYQENEARNAEADRMLDPPPDGEAPAPEEPAAAEPAAAESTPDTGDGADVIPFPSRPGEDPADPAPAEPATPEPPASTTDEGTPAMPDTAMPNQTATEVTNHESARMFILNAALYVNRLKGVLADVPAQVDAMNTGLAAEAAAHEGAASSLAGAGFETGMTGNFTAGQEALNTAAELCGTAHTSTTAAMEQLDIVLDKLQESMTAFGGQQTAIAEALAAAQETNQGVATETKWYTGG